MGDARAGLEFLQGTWRAEFRDMNIDRRLFTTEVEVTGNVAIFHPNRYQITCSPEGVVELTDGSGLVWWLQKYSPWVRRNPFLPKCRRSSKAVWLLDPQIGDPTPNSSMSRIVWWLLRSPVPVMARQEALMRLRPGRRRAAGDATRVRKLEKSKPNDNKAWPK
ncbi:EPS15 [Symbiodinium microadriaticum]|nr:EPS15 [Symbiodinium microadriaticum]